MPCLLELLLDILSKIKYLLFNVKLLIYYLMEYFIFIILVLTAIVCGWFSFWIFYSIKQFDLKSQRNSYAFNSFLPAFGAGCFIFAAVSLYPNWSYIGFSVYLALVGLPALWKIQILSERAREKQKEIEAGLQMYRANRFDKKEKIAIYWFWRVFVICSFFTYLAIRWLLK